MSGYDGSIKFDTKIDSSGLKEALEKVKKSFSEMKSTFAQFGKSGEKTFDGLAKAFSKIDKKAEVTGNEIDAVKEKKKLLLKTIDGLIKSGINPEDARLKALQATFKSLTAVEDSYKKKNVETTNSIKTGLNGITKALAAIGITASITAAIAGLKTLGQESLAAASAAEETRNKFNVTFSEVQKEANAAADELVKFYGASRQGAESLLADTADLLSGLGATQEQALEAAHTIATLGTDLASYTNVAGGAANAQMALNALFTGERERVKAYGISIQEVDLKNFAKEQGLAYNAISKFEKGMLSLKLAMTQSKNAIGDFQRSQDSYANVSRVAESATEDLKSALGDRLLPIATKIKKAYIEIARAITDTIRAENELKEAREAEKEGLTTVDQRILLLEKELGILDQTRSRTQRDKEARQAKINSINEEIEALRKLQESSDVADEILQVEELREKRENVVEEYEKIIALQNENSQTSRRALMSARSEEEIKGEIFSLDEQILVLEEKINLAQSGGGGGQDGVNEWTEKRIALQKELEKELLLISEKEKLYGAEYDAQAARKAAVQGTLNKMIEAGFTAEGAGIKRVMAEYEEYLGIKDADIQKSLTVATEITKKQAEINSKYVLGLRVIEAKEADGLLSYNEAAEQKIAAIDEQINAMELLIAEYDIEDGYIKTILADQIALRNKLSASIKTQTQESKKETSEMINEASAMTNNFVGLAINVANLSSTIADEAATAQQKIAALSSVIVSLGTVIGGPAGVIVGIVGAFASLASMASSTAEEITTAEELVSDAIEAFREDLEQGFYDIGKTVGEAISDGILDGTVSGYSDIEDDLKAALVDLLAAQLLSVSGFEDAMAEIAEELYSALVPNAERIAEIQEALDALYEDVGLETSEGLEELIASNLEEIEDLEDAAEYYAYRARVASTSGAKAMYQSKAREAAEEAESLQNYTEKLQEILDLEAELATLELEVGELDEEALAAAEEEIEKYTALLEELYEELGVLADSTEELSDQIASQIDLLTAAENALDSYDSQLEAVQESVLDFYESLTNVGADITDILIDSLVDGLDGDDFLYALEEYITEAVIQAAVFTEEFMAEVSEIGAELAAAIASGADAETIAALKDRLATLYEEAQALAQAATSTVNEAFGSYASGTISVDGDQLANIHDQEMILPSGISEEARQAGIYIGPMSGENGISSQTINLNLMMNSDMNVDGEKIGAISYQYLDQFIGGSYGI